MHSVCLILHDLQPASKPGRHAWAFAGALARAGASVSLLHTGAAGEEQRRDYRERAALTGVSYANLEDFAASSEPELYPAIDAHRTGWRVLRALERIDPGAAFFLDAPAHAASSAAARKTALSLQACTLSVVMGEPAMLARHQAGVFPTEGRHAMGLEYLERCAARDADRLLCGEEASVAWMLGEVWSLPGLRPAPAFMESAEDASATAWLELAAFRADQKPEPLSLPSVSVCVPYYEQPEFLPEALADLARQDMAPLEVLVLDDGSRHPEALAAFERERQRYAERGWLFVRQENAGPGAARNHAASLAKGDALLFCDADNRFEPRMLSTLARALASTGAEAVTCAFRAFTQKPGEQPEPGYVFAPLGACRELALLENIIGDTNAIFRRASFLAEGGFRADNRSASEDWQLLLSMLGHGLRVETVPGVLFDYRVSPESHARSINTRASSLAALGAELGAVPAPWKLLWEHASGMLRDPLLFQMQARLDEVGRKLLLLREQSPSASEHAALKLELSELRRAMETGELHAAERQRLTERHVFNLEALAAAGRERILELETTALVAAERQRLTEQHVCNLETLAAAGRARILDLETTALAAAERQRLTERHAANLEAITAAGREHIRGLEAAVGAAAERQRLTEQHAADLEAAAAAGRERILELETIGLAAAERQRLTEQHVSNLEATLLNAAERQRLTEQHASNLETALRTREEEGAAESARLTGLLRAAEARLAELESSYTWRLSAPLRRLGAKLGL